MSAAFEGVGLALVEVPRFRAVLERRGERFAARVFSPGELAYARRKKLGWQNLAARFAAKLAGRQALRAELGRALPLCRARGGAREERRAAARVHAARRESSAALAFSLSLTHDADFALASVWVEAAP